jgi:hypothetical protein
MIWCIYTAMVLVPAPVSAPFLSQILFLKILLKRKKSTRFSHSEKTSLGFIVESCTVQFRKGFNLCYFFNLSYTVQKEQGVHLVSLMQREIILYMVSAICVSTYLADFYLLSKFASLE